MSCLCGRAFSLLNSAVLGTGGGGGWNGMYALDAVENSRVEKSSSAGYSPSCVRAAEFARLIAVAREDSLVEPVDQLSRVLEMRDSTLPMIVRSIVFDERC